MAQTLDYPAGVATMARRRRRAPPRAVSIDRRRGHRPGAISLKLTGW